MKYQETGRLGRITKNLRKNGFEENMEKILFDSTDFNKLTEKGKVGFIETIVNRMEKEIGEDSTKRVLFSCGEQCCGKSWATFAMNIWNSSTSLENFFTNLNNEEEKYNTSFSYKENLEIVYVKRSKCICGLINKGNFSNSKNLFCTCSNGHMTDFFNSIFSVKEVILEQSISSGASECTWRIELNKWNKVTTV